MSNRRQTVDNKTVEGFPSATWGPGLWKFMHLAALGVRLNPTDAELQGYLDFFRGLGYVLPCGVCRREYRRLIGPNGPLTIRKDIFKNRRTAFEWTVKIHDAVSRRLGHKRVNASKDWGAEYEKLRYIAEYRNWTDSLSYSNYIYNYVWNATKQKDEVMEIRNFVMTSNPAVLYITPVKWEGLRYDRGRAKRKWELFRRRFGDNVRFGVVPLSKFRAAFAKNTNSHRNVKSDTYVLFRDGAYRGVVRTAEEAVLNVMQMQ
ncbi:hypothetical protein EBT31_15165 [bacterium]|jgi:hypothetical protein|nr:hypothetical protein [bacterium]